jgi:sigma-B regulation protein RsbU (phosphoserine phosphatase)
MAAQVAIAIENATLYERIARQERLLEHDLALARELQFRLLPQKRPALKHAEVAARFSPARQIGGDLYDFLKYSGRGIIGIAVGDVSGKGAPAAIYAGLVSGTTSSHALEEPSAAQMLEAVNLSLAERPIEAQYVTMLYAVWHDSDRTLQVANAGLPLPLRLRDGKFEEIQVTGLPMGLFASADYEEQTLRCKPGDVFLFFTDGITDATSSKGNMFGRGRLEKAVLKSADGSADEIAQAVFTAVSDHAKGVDPFDDQTIVVLKVKGNPAKK